MAELKITVDTKQVERMLAKAPALTRKRLGQLVEHGAIEVQREMRLVAPVAVTGDLRRSVRYTYNATSLSAVIEPTAKYAAAVENGARPHWPPYKAGTPLAQWAKKKGMNAYLLARSISKKGTKPHPFVKPTYDKMRPRIEANLKQGVAQLAQELNSGRI